MTEARLGIVNMTVQETLLARLNTKAKGSSLLNDSPLASAPSSSINKAGAHPGLSKVNFDSFQTYPIRIL